MCGKRISLSCLSLLSLVSLSSFIFLRTRGAPQKRRRRRRRREGRGEDKDKDVDDDGDETDQDDDDDKEEEHERTRVVSSSKKKERVVVLVSPSTRRSSSFGRLKRDRVHELSPVDSATPIFNFNSHLSADDLEEFVFVHALGKPSRGRVEWKHGTGV